MTDTGFLTSGTQANDGTGTTPWTNLGNVNASDNAYATAAVAISTTSQGALLTNFGFSIPAGAIILGVEATIELSQTPSSRMTDLTMQIIKGGTPGGTNKAQAGFWPATDSTRTYGSATDLWGNTLTAADVNASNFGIKFRSQQGGTGLSTGQLDLIQLKVYYQVSTGSANGAGAATGVGAAQFRGVASSSGVGAATGVGKSQFRGVASSTGVGVATGVGKSQFRASASSAGIAAAAAVSKATKRSVGNAAGVGAANGIGTSTGGTPTGSGGSIYRIIYRCRRGRK